MTTIDRRAFLESATALAAVAALRPRPAAAAGGTKKALYVSMLPKELGLPRAVPARARRGLRGHRDRDDHRRRSGRRDQGGLREDRAHDPLRDERRPLEVPALERGPGGRVEERRRDGGVAAQREAVGMRQRAPRARGGEPRDLLQGRLDALAEGRQGAHPPARPGAEGRDRDGERLEQVPPLPARDGPLRGRVRLALRQGLPRRGQHALLRLPPGLGPHPREEDPPRPHQGLQARPREGEVRLDEPRRGRRGLAGGPQGPLARSVTTAGSPPRSRAATRPT